MCAHPLVTNPNNIEPPRTPSPAEASKPERSPLTLSNPDVLRSCYVGAILAALLGNLAYYLFFLWYPAAGFFAVYNYQRRTGIFPRVGEGVRLGLATGGISFLVSLALFTLALLVAGDPAMFGEAIREQIQLVSAPDDVKQQMLNTLKSPAAMSAMLLFSLVMSFAITILLSTIGGALGAKVLGPE